MYGVYNTDEKVENGDSGSKSNKLDLYDREVFLKLREICEVVRDFRVGDNNSKQLVLDSGYFGCVVTIIGFLQPINAFFRPHAVKDEPKTAKRKYWEYLHKGSGWFAIVLAVPTICIGTTLAGATSSLEFQITYIVLVTFLLVIIGFLLKDRAKNSIPDKEALSTELA